MCIYLLKMINKCWMSNYGFNKNNNSAKSGHLYEHAKLMS